MVRNRNKVIFLLSIIAALFIFFPVRNYASILDDTAKCLDAGGSYVNGKCVIPEKPKCTTHSSKKCKNGDVYWTDSCGALEGIYKDCPDNSACSKAACKCNKGYVMKSGVCVEKQQKKPVKECEAHASKKCSGGDVYWADSCGAIGSIYESCPENSECSSAACNCKSGYVMRAGLCEKKQKKAVSGGSTSCPSGFVYIAPGTFTMGSPSSEGGRDSDEKQHRVEISRGFCMGNHEVTQGEWEAVMGSNPSNFKNCGSNCPVEQVSWNDAQDFINKYNAEHGGGYRLPTEAEWEYAARGGTTAAFYTGDITNTGNNCGNDAAMDRAGWYCGNSGVNYAGCYDASGMGGPKCGGSHPVGQKEANTWGLYDMLGNVWEWVEDWYANYPSGSVTDPVGPSSGSLRVFRGGGWYGSAGFCRSADRHSYAPGGRNGNLGFRLARTLP